MLSAANRAVVDVVRSELREQGVATFDTKSSHTVHEAILALKSRPKEAVGIVTSRRSIESYDPCHPERIACILVKETPIHFYVILNDRETEIGRIIRTWRNIDPFDEYRLSECVVCMCSLCPNKNMKTRTFSVCSSCFTSTCKRCVDKMEDDGCMKCPTCRRWNLCGGDFGVPFVGPHNETKTMTHQQHAIDTLCDRVLSRLDGRVVIVFRRDSTFLFEDALHLTKLARTTRYTECSMRVQKVRKDLKRLCDRYLHLTPDIHIWLLRKTFKIDGEADKPVEEVCVFRVGRPMGPDDAPRLIQLGTNSWRDVVHDTLVGEDYVFHPVKKTYLPPVRFEIPDPIREVLTDIADKNRFELTASFAIENDENDLPLSGLNFDIDATNGTLDICTIHTDSVGARLAVMIDNDRPLLMSVRIHRYESYTCDIMTYRYDNDGVISKLDSSTCETQARLDRDRLMGTRNVVRFL